MTQPIFSVSCDLKLCIGYRLILVYKALVMFTLCCIVWLYTIFKKSELSTETVNLQCQ